MPRATRTLIALAAAVLTVAIAAPSAVAATKPTQIEIISYGVQIDTAYVLGVLRSPAAACERGRSVQLFRVRRAPRRGAGAEKPVDSARSSRKGAFGLAGSMTPDTGGFFLTVPRSQPKRGLTCRAASEPLPLPPD